MNRRDLLRRALGAACLGLALGMGLRPSRPEIQEELSVTWEYWNGTGWSELDVESVMDEWGRLIGTRSGVIPDDAAPIDESGRKGIRYRCVDTSQAVFEDPVWIGTSHDPRRMGLG